MNKNNFWKKCFFLHLPRDLLTDVLSCCKFYLVSLPVTIKSLKQLFTSCLPRRHPTAANTLRFNMKEKYIHRKCDPAKQNTSMPDRVSRPTCRHVVYLVSGKRSAVRRVFLTRSKKPPPFKPPPASASAAAAATAVVCYLTPRAASNMLSVTRFDCSLPIRHSEKASVDENGNMYGSFPCARQCLFFLAIVSQIYMFLDGESTKTYRDEPKLTLLLTNYI